MNIAREWFLAHGLEWHDARTARNVTDDGFVSHAKQACTEAETEHIDFCVAFQADGLRRIVDVSEVVFLGARSSGGAARAGRVRDSAGRLVVACDREDLPMNLIEQYGTKLLRSCAEEVAKGVITGPDWPNSQDELTRLQAAQLLREAANKLDNAPPDYRGYAHLGAGQYLINHSAHGEPAELVISIATDEEKAGRTVGDDAENAGDMLQPDAMAVRIRFQNAASLDALEKQLHYLRMTHFSESVAYAQQEPDKHLADLRRVAYLDMMLCSPNLHHETAKEMRREKNLILHGTEYLPDHIWDDEDPPECAESLECDCGDDTCVCAA